MATDLTQHSRRYKHRAIRLSTLHYRSVILALQGVTVGLALQVRLAEDLVEGIRLLDTQETNSKDDEQRQTSHDHAPRSHGKQEKRNQNVNNVASAEREQSISELRMLQLVRESFGGLDRDAKHDQTHDSRQHTNQAVQVKRDRGEVYGGDSVELAKGVRRDETLMVNLAVNPSTGANAESYCTKKAFLK